MKDRATIQMDYNKAIAKADELDDLKNDINRCIYDELEVRKKQIQKSWRSDCNETKYEEKYHLVIGEIRNTMKNMTMISSTIREIAKNTYDAEMEALRIAEEREAEAARARAEAEKAQYKMDLANNSSRGKTTKKSRR